MRRHGSERCATASLLFAIGMVFALMLFLPREANASLIELTARPATGDTVYWGQLGAFGPVGSPLNFTSTGGTTGSVNLNGSGDLVVQCCIGITGNFNGDFAPGDAVIETYPSNNLGPLSINFNTPVQIVGAQIQTNVIGQNFTAEIFAFNGSVLLGTFTENGFSGDVGDNSDPFLGVEDATTDITSVTYLTFTSNPFALQQVAINQMTIEGSQTPVPAALPLFATGIGGLGLLGWRRKRKAVA